VSESSCAIFLSYAVISRNTHDRDKGYFRLASKLAVDRCHLIKEDAGHAKSSPLTDVERGRVLEAVETLRRDDAEILRFSILAETAMHQLGISVGDYHPLAGSVSLLPDPQRVFIELEKSPMAQQCVNDLKRSLQIVR
jgi:hypothetical protein